MKFSALAAIVAAVAAAPASISNTWSTLTPTGTLNESASAITSISGSYALSIRTVSASVSQGISQDKRDVVSQIGDGQIQANSNTEVSKPPATTTASVINQIGDGQVQQQTASVVNQIGDGQIQQQTTASVVNQIGDGQIQQQTTASVVNQIGDGQIQQQTTASVVNQIGDGQIQQQTQTASVVNQIGDGQIQQQTAAPKSASVVDQIGDGQIQQHTTASVANQIGDGQIQQQSVAAESTHAPSQSVVNQVTDGQVQATGAASSDPDSPKDYFEETCVSDDSLLVSLTDGELRDSKGRVGAIVANRQFQFDGPPPQAGTIYAAGWSFVPADVAGLGEKQSDTKEGGFKLALGDQTTFYKCLSGDFYNLYDESIGAQCSAIEIFLLKAVDC
ncbi:hypothetical protein ACI3LY_003345 [Candidozyma auris]|uniref:Cell wall mannoprotein PIR1-like C-terminal domain-containing protein n=2 Tax=Candidozyma auris TaxID=498019 RepID=A0ABF7SXV0_CANAR|nr:hypothetical protein QG37_00093 [[Candida] auris]PIS52296.1 hypothetical protein B9J08_003910 [[Candida] auris]PIS54408.1 hypothetical protein CJI97_004111 [[Candida] auris]QWW21311.1 hypothetical protein CA7LBN_000057 [[Candida] auris]